MKSLKNSIYLIYKTCGLFIISLIIGNALVMVFKTSMMRYLLNNLDTISNLHLITILLLEIISEITIRILASHKYISFNRLINVLTEKITVLNINWRDHYTTGDLQKMYEYVNSITTTIQNVIMIIEKFFELSFAIYLICSKYISFKYVISLYIVWTVIFESILTFYLYRPVSKKKIELCEERDRLNSDLTLNLNLMSMYSNAANYLKSKIITLNRNINKMCLMNTSVIILSIFIGFITYDCVLLYLFSHVNVIDKIKVFILLSTVTDPIFWILDLLPDIIDNNVKFKKISNIIYRIADITEGSKKLLIDNDYVIEFRKVNYSYDNKREVLKDISFTIKKGQTVAFVGETGCGKSTLIKLLTRQIDPINGEILINGVNIKDYTISSLRNIFGVISQDVEIMADTIRFNISMSVLPKEVTDDEILETCKGPLKNKIDELKDGLNTFVGDRGVKLSGGLKQLIALARILLSKKEILVLDEATSALDNISEKEVLKAINESLPNRTIISVAHRLTTIKNFDVINVIKDGSIVESGTYEELIELNGEFNKMIDSRIKKMN